MEFVKRIREIELKQTQEHLDRRNIVVYHLIPYFSIKCNKKST